MHTFRNKTPDAPARAETPAAPQPLDPASGPPRKRAPGARTYAAPAYLPAHASRRTRRAARRRAREIEATARRADMAARQAELDAERAERRTARYLPRAGEAGPNSCAPTGR